MTGENFNTDRQLLVEIASGNEKAFEQLFDKYWSRVYNIAITYLKLPEQAEDITQEIFLKIWVRRSTLAAIDSLENYLFIVTRNEVYSKLRKKTPVYPVGPWLGNLEETQLLPDKILDARRLQALISEAETQLPSRQLQAWRLNREQGLSYEQVADAMNITKNTAKNHIVKSLNFIREYILSATGEILPAIILLLFF